MVVPGHGTALVNYLPLFSSLTDEVVVATDLFSTLIRGSAFASVQSPRSGAVTPKGKARLSLHSHAIHLE